MKTITTDWELIPYSEAWSRQTEWFDALVHAKQNGESYENRIIFCEHPHVYTLGRSGKENNMLLGEEQLKAIGATLYHIDRGGDITYHGPGQLVCYPILNLEEFGLGLKEYVHLLEEAVIRVCASYGVVAGGVGEAAGGWLGGGTAPVRLTVCGGAVGEGDRCLAGGRYVPCPQDMCDRGQEQPLCDNARIGIECQYRFTLFQLHPSLWFH